jgi:hypothetical protein
MTIRQKLNGWIFASENCVSFNKEEIRHLKINQNNYKSNHQALTPETSQLLCLTSVLGLPKEDRRMFQCSVNDWTTSILCVSVLLVIRPLLFYAPVSCSYLGHYCSMRQCPVHIYAIIVICAIVLFIFMLLLLYAPVSCSYLGYYCYMCQCSVNN